MMARGKDMKGQLSKPFWKKKIHMIGIGLVLGVFALGTYLLFGSGQIQGYRYAHAYNKEDFEKVFEYYHQDTVEKDFNKEEIVTFLTQQKEVDGTIKVQDLNIISIWTDVFKGIQEVDLEIEYTGNTQAAQKKLTLVKDYESKQWLVVFPYELQNISVFAPTGASVYLGEKEISHEGNSEEIEIKNILPGRHQITIAYYEDMYPAFVKEIFVPMETRVDSPYPTFNIAVFAPYSTWVTVGNVTKYNAGPSVVFENMLPGQYKVSISMKDKRLEIFSQTIQIENEYTSIHLEKIAGNKLVKEDLEKFFTVFNVEYEQGIVSRDVNFLHMFATEKTNENLISDFKMWYIDHKEVKNAKSLMEIRDSYVLSGNEVKASVLEKVYLTSEDQAYKVVIEWNYKLVRSDLKWKIAQRDILQSIVTYENEAGKWISY